MTVLCPLCGSAAQLPELVFDENSVYVRGTRITSIRGKNVVFFHELFSHIGELVRKSYLMYKMYPITADFDRVGEKIIDVRLCKLRSEIEKLNLNLTIETIYGVGYIMRWKNVNQ